MIMAPGSGPASLSQTSVFFNDGVMENAEYHDPLVQANTRRRLIDRQQILVTSSGIAFDY